MDIAMLTQMIQSSQLLMDSEKQYWTQNLPRMNESQLERLKNILERAKKVNWTDHIKNYLTQVARAADQTDPALAD